MKCPVCQIMCSDLRDLCPKCYFDLRLHKRALGMTVSYPDLAYNDLIDRYAGRPAQQPAASGESIAPPVRRLIGKFAGLFKKAAAPGASSPTTEVAPPAPAEAVRVEEPTPGEPTPPIVEPPSFSDLPPTVEYFPDEEEDLPLDVGPATFEEKTEPAPIEDAKPVELPDTELLTTPTEELVEDPAQPVPREDPEPPPPAPPISAPTQELKSIDIDAADAELQAMLDEINQLANDPPPIVEAEEDPPDEEIRSLISELTADSSPQEPPELESAEVDQEQPVEPTVTEEQAVELSAPEEQTAPPPMVDSPPLASIFDRTQTTEVAETERPGSAPEVDPLFDDSLISAALEDLDSGGAGESSRVVPFSPPKRSDRPRSAFKTSQPTEDVEPEQPPPPTPIEPPIVELPIETFVPDEPVPTPPPPPAMPQYLPYEQIDHSAVTALFTEGMTALATEFTPDEIELSFAELNQFQPSEECELYFMLAYDVLEKPELEQQLKTEFAASESRMIESKDLNQALANVERRMSDAARSLRPLAGMSGPTSTAIISPLPAQGRAPSVMRRIFAGAIDLACAFAGAALIWLLYSVLFDFGQLANLSRPSESYAYLRMSSFALAALLLVLQFYLTASLISEHRTLGTKLTKISILRESGAGITRSNAIVRGLVFPLSLLLGGWLPILWGKRAVHDALAKTVVIRRWRF